MTNIVEKVCWFCMCLLFACSSVASAEPVTTTIAEAVGSVFLEAQDSVELATSSKRDSQEDVRGYESHSISTVTQLRHEETGELLAYVFALEPKGFVVVSPDTDITPIIAYSFEGNFNWKDSEGNVLLNMLTYDMRNRVEMIAVTPEDLIIKSPFF